MVELALNPTAEISISISVALEGMAVKLVIEKEIEQGNSLQICVGCDSQVQGKYISFATVIVFIRKGKGGFMYLSKSTEHIKMQINR